MSNQPSDTNKTVLPKAKNDLGQVQAASQPKTPAGEAVAALYAAAATLDGDAGFFGKAGDAPYDAHRALADRCRKAAEKLSAAR